MEVTKLREWESAVDQADANRLTQNLPEGVPVGFVQAETGPDNIFRKWVYCEVSGGNPGSRWAYWSNKAECRIIVDRIFNGDASHFAGMLAHPYAGTFHTTKVWVMLEPRAERIPETREAERSDQRYERSREIFDVETQSTTKL